MERRTRWIVGGLLAALAAGAWVLQQGTWLSARLRVPIEAGLASATGRQVSIGGVGGGLSGWLWLHDVSMGPGPVDKALDVSFTAEAVGLKLDAWALLKGQADLASLQAVQVRSPRLYILRRDLPAAQTPSAGAMEDWQRRLAGLPLPPVSLELRNGEAWDQANGKVAAKLADGVRLGLEPDKDGSWRLQGHADLQRGGGLDVWGRSRAGWQGLQLRLRARNLSLAGLCPAGSSLTFSAGILSGDLEARLQAGTWPGGVVLKGQGNVEKLALPLANGRAGVQDLSAHWRLEQGRLDLSDGVAQAAGGHLRGKAVLDLAAQAVALTASAKQTDLAALAAISGAPAGLGLAGHADLELTIFGPLSATTASAALRARGALWQGHALERADLRAQLAGGQLQASGELGWDGGQGSVSVELQNGVVASAALKAQALPADWLQAWAGGGLEGRFDGEGRYRRQPGGQTPWELALRSSRFKARDLVVEKGALQASGDARSARLRVEGDLASWPGLNASGDAVAQHDGTWALKNLKVFQRERPLGQASGSWKPGAKGQVDALSLNIKTAALSVALWPGLRDLNGLSGTAQAEGDLSLGAEGWSGSLQLNAPGLQRGKVPLAASAFLRFNPEGVSLSAMNLRQGELRGEATAPAWTGPWSGEARLEKAWLPAYGVAPQGVSGRASGMIRFSGGGRGSLSAQLQWLDPLPAVLPQAQVSLQLDGQGGRWELQKLDLQQGPGSLHATGMWDSAGKTPFKGEAHWEALQVQGVASSGQARLAGGAGSPGHVSVGPWSLSQTALPALEAELAFVDGGFHGLNARWGEATRLQAEHGPLGWDLRADLQGQDPGPLLGPWMGRLAVTPLRLSGWIVAKAQGVSNSAKLSAELRDDASVASGLKANGEWRAGVFQGQAEWKGWELKRLRESLHPLGVDLPVLQGRLGGSLNASSAGLTFSAQATGLVWRELDLGSGSLEAFVQGRHWDIHDLQAGSSGPRLHLMHATWEVGAKGGKGAADLELEAWPQSIFTISGQGKLKASAQDGKGAWESQWQELQIGERHWKGLAVEGGWDGPHWSVRESGRHPGLRAEGRSQDGIFELSDLQAQAGQGKATLKGSIGADGELDWEGSAMAFPVGELTGVMGWAQTWTGLAYGSLKVGGSTAKARTVVSVKIEDGSVEGLPFDLATGLVHQDGDWVDLAPLQPIRLSRKNGVALEVGGKVPLDDGKGTATGLDVWAELKQGGLGLFAGTPVIRAAEGPLELSLHFRGRRDDPQVSGRLRITDGKLTPAWMLPPLDKLEVFAQLEDGQVILQQAQARVAGGGPLLKLELAEAKRPAFTMERWLPAAFNLKLRASKSGLAVRSTPWLHFLDATLQPDLRLAGTWEEPILSGTVLITKGDLDKAIVTLPARFDPVPKEGDKGFFDRLRYDLKVLARQDVLARTEAAQVFVDTGEQGLHLSGSGGDRLLEGRLRLTQGSVDYLLANFQLASDRETLVELRGASPPALELWGVKKVRNVLLNGEAQARDVEVTLHAFGPLGQVNVELTSDAQGPTGEVLRQEQLISLAGLGVDSSDPRSQGGFARILGKVPAGLLTRWARRSGIMDEVGVRLPAVEEALGGARQTPGPLDTAPSYQSTPVTSTGKALVELRAGKYLGENLFLGVNGLLTERQNAQGGSSLDPAMGGEVDYQLKDKTKLSAQQNVDTSGQSEQRVMVERSSRFENYNPRKRRWDTEATPGPTAAPSPVQTPWPTPN